MKRTFTFLMTALFLCMGVTNAAVTDLPQLSTEGATKWYTVKNVRTQKFATYAGDDATMTQQATASAAAFFYFTASTTEGAVKIHNYAAGEKLCAAYNSWTATGIDWYLAAQATGVSICTSTGEWNAWNDASGAGQKVEYWSASDAGSAWEFVEVTDFSAVINISALKEAAVAEVELLASVSAIYPSAADAVVKINAVQATGTGLAELNTAAKAIEAVVADYKNAAYQALEGKYFTISTPGRNNLFMNLADERVKGVASVENTLSALWQFQCVDGTVRIFNPATEMYLCEPQGNSAEVLVTASAADAGLYQLAVNANAENPAAKIKFTSNGKSVHMAGHSVLVRWDNGGASEWTVAETVVDITKDIAALLEANAENHAELPALGQYSTEGYNALLEAKNTVTTLKQAAAAAAVFETTKNLPLFTIDSQKDYALGQSIYENEEGALKFKTTDAADKSMLWAFDMTATEVGLTDKVAVRNAATGKLFWGASFISVIETEPAVEGDGVFMFKTEGTGSPVHAQANGSSIVRWSSADANAVGGASTWKFTFVGVSNPAAYDLSEVAASFKEQAMAFAGLQENAALSALPAVQEKWAEGMGVVEPLFGAVEEGNLVLKADVVAAMEMMAEIQAVVAYYSETFAAAKDEANAAMDELDEESEEYKALLGAINVSTVTTVTELEAKAEIIAEVLEYLASLPVVDPNDYTSYIVNADLSTGDAWNTEGTKGISGGMVKVASESAFDFSQTITLPAGQYKMTAKAAYRYTGSEQDEYNAILAGTETHLVKLYAETASYKYEGDVQNRWEGASDTNLAGDGVSEVNGMFVPNSSNAVLAWFNAGQYVNELVFNVQEEGAVKIGITRVGGIAGDYTNIGAWTLRRLGDAEADPTPEPEPEPEPDPTPDPEEPEETVDLDMTHKVSRDWEGKSGNVTIDGIAMSEKYEGNADPVGDQLWQTVTGLENGKYTVKLWANARVAWVGSPAADGQEELTYIFANNVEKSIAVLLNPNTNGNVLRTLEGVEVTDGTLRMGMKKVAPGSNWHSIQIESLTLHATNEVIANIAKVDLKAALDAANAVSPITDEFAAAIAAAQNVYDNSTDAEEVKAAVASLKAATKLAILMNATEENPVLTDFVVNGTFDAGTTGWKSTTGAQNQGTATNQQGAFTGAFFENWNGSNYTGKLYQVIENVPNGIYELSICAFVETFDASAQFVYANADKVALTTGAPTAYTVRTIVENNTIEVGFEQTAAVNRWCGIDNVSLTYLGEASNEALVNAAKEAFTTAYEEFGAALAACQAMMLKMSFYEIDDAAYQLNEQLETTTDVDALNTMAETLAEATASLKEINEVYADYDVFVQKFKAAAEISEPKTTEAAEILEFNMYGGAGMQATSLEALAQAVETIKADYFTYIANAKLLDGNKFDLTYLIQNPDFAMNLDGWTGVKANRIGGEGYDGVGGIAEIGEWGASSWDASMSQAITNLPNGKYVVKAAWMAASGIEMTFSANAGETTVTGIGDMGGNIAKDGSVVEMGQGHRGWQYVEVEGLVEDGTLTILVSSSSAAQYMWSNADAFELYYAGVPKVDVAEVALNETAIEFEELGVTFQLEATVTPVDATSPAVTWTSSDDAVATVDENGLVTAVAVGTATITATADGVSATCAVTVTNIYDLSEVKDAFVAQAQEFMALAEGNMALYKLTALQTKCSEVMTLVNTLYEQIAGEEKVLKSSVVAAMEAMTTTKAEVEPVVAYYNEAYNTAWWDADDVLQSLDTDSEDYATLDAAIVAASDLSAVTTVAELEEKVAAINAAVAALYDLSEVKDAFVAQAQEFMALAEGNMALYKLTALQTKCSEVMTLVNTLYEQIAGEEKVLKSSVVAAMEAMTTTKAEVEPVVAYYNEAYNTAWWDADDVLQSLDTDSEDYATLDAAIVAASDLSAVTTVAELEEKVAAINAAVAALYNLDEAIEGEWEDVTYAAPGEWAIIDDAELLGLGAYWEHTGYTNYDNARGVMEFVAGENTSAYLKQDYCPIYTPGTYRLTGKAFHKGATNAVMYVQNNETLTVEIPAAAEGASYENAEEYFTTFSIEFEVTSVTQVNVGYSCDFTNAEDFLVVGGFKLEMKSSTSLRNIFMETIMACESFGYEIMAMEALHADQQEVMAVAMPIYEAIMGDQKVLKSEVEQSIEDMQAIMAELNPVAEYYKGEFMNALYAAEEFKSTLDEASQAYTDLEAAINEAKDVAAVTTVAELEAKVAALEELMRLIETGIENIETETETVIYDLSGRRVTEMTKGIYIVNGKKVLVK